MAQATKEALVSLRLTGEEKRELELTARLCGQSPTPLAAAYVREGIRRSRFPAVDFRDGAPGRVAYLTGTRWPVWMIVDLVRELGGDTAAAARHLRKPEPLVRMALAYAAAYPAEIEACLALHAERDFEGLKTVSPALQAL
jgi:uncharacterized protein (DUF433 family)